MKTTEGQYRRGRSTAARLLLGAYAAALVGCAGSAPTGDDDQRARMMRAEIHSQKARLAEQQAEMQSMAKSLEEINKKLGSAPAARPVSTGTASGTAGTAGASETGATGWKPGASAAPAAPAAPVGEPVAAAAPNSTSGTAIAVAAPSVGSVAGATADKPADAKPADAKPAEPEVVAGKDRFREQVSDTLKELLKDPEFAKQFKTSGGPQVGYKKDVSFQSSGFFIEDGDFRLNFEGRLQVRYTYANYLDKNSRNGAVRTDDTNFDTRSDFNIPRLRLDFNGFAYSKDLTYKLELNATSNNRAGGDGGGGGIGDIVNIEKAYMNWNVLGSNKDVPEFWRNALEIRFGEDYMPFGRTESINHWGQQTSGDIEQVDYNLAQQTFRVDRAVALQVHGMFGGTMYGLPEDRPGTKGFLEYIFALSNGIQSAGQRYGIDSGGTGTAGRGLDKYPAITARLNADILKGKYEGLDGKDYYWFGRNTMDLEHHQTPAWQLGGSFHWQRQRDQNNPGNNPVLGDFYNPTQQVERLPVYNSKNQVVGFTNGNTLPYDKYSSDIIRVAADTSFKWKGFSLTSEFYYQHINAADNGANTNFRTATLTNPAGTSQIFPIASATQDQDNFGWYVNTGYFVIPRKWELFVGGGMIHSPSRPLAPANGTLTVVPNNPTQTQINNALIAAGAQHAAGTDGSQNGDTAWVTFGTNWFPFENRKLKVQLDASYLINPDINSASQNFVQRGGENNWLLRAQVQFAF